ncbi:MAG: type II toxin-antitoxin system RelE/ParE family toxin [Lactobacillales bacterium]|jgi:mRNA interferase RelE/StbE|nr:type II toxin-antitoxin system RelE/ParE family toxin [Lactobacillales bacterium]
MKRYKVKLKESAKKALEKMDKYQATLILKWLNKHLENTDNPRLHGKGLSGNYSHKWRYRIGIYRLIADIQDETLIILVIAIRHRKDIY